ncbi:MAG TPA: hypothetical protein VGH49_08835 [Xanthobacteraceae bacterium]|jgi:hypothetical protein
MKSKIATALIATLALGATVVAGSSQAQAHHFHGWGWGGVGLGLATGALIGAAVADDYYVPRCHFVRQFDRFGNYVGTAKVCGY